MVVQFGNVTLLNIHKSNLFLTKKLKQIGGIKMLIRKITDGHKSEWMLHNRKNHMEMLKNPPEEVEIRICDFYPHSPDKNKTQVISFELFNCIARKFILHEKAEQKSDKRHIATDTSAKDVASEFDVLDEILKAERDLILMSALKKLTEIQYRRIWLKYFENLTFTEIANKELVDEKAIRKSIEQALKKLYKILKL